MNLAEPATLWAPLSAAEWNREAARHLLRRVAWTATPGEVERAGEEGLAKTLERYFPAAPAYLPKTEAIERLEAQLPELLAASREATGPARQAAQRELRERSQAVLQDLRLKWLHYAADPARAAFAKWVLFLGDVYVVSAEKVRNPELLWKHGDVLARDALGPAPALTKAVSRSPAMVRYLDLDQSAREAPNENFARELFELFVLGEGNYTEQDIKEAARAFTGYRVAPLTGEFRIARGKHDGRSKTIFGRSGKFSGDDVIDLAYEQRAAATFLPREMARFYLCESALPPAALETLGERWRAENFDLRRLALTFFGSRAFFSPEFRGNLIKSPVQFYLGALQDLRLDVPPLPRYALNPLRQMGQQLFQPPNVRGWVGGRNWINSTTLAARRNFVRQLFAPFREEQLNADERQALDAARAAGLARFTVSDEWLGTIASDRSSAIDQLGRALLPAEAAAGQRIASVLKTYLDRHPERPNAETALRTALVALLQTPEYQLC